MPSTILDGMGAKNTPLERYELYPIPQMIMSNGAIYNFTHFYVLRDLILSHCDTTPCMPRPVPG